MTIPYHPLLWLVIAALSVGIFAVISGLGLYQTRLGVAAEESLQLRLQLQRLRLLRSFLFLLVGILIGGGLFLWQSSQSQASSALQVAQAKLKADYNPESIWTSPDWSLAEMDPDFEQISYGRELIINTADYFGPSGLVLPGNSNKLNCQNCHLDAGTKAFGNNYSKVASTYPKMRGRSGKEEGIPSRINGCFQRSLNGKPLAEDSKEMKAMVAYVNWLGTAVPKGDSPKGSGLVQLEFLDRPADPEKGAMLFAEKCASCHGQDGQGMPMPGSERSYPPLWGKDSYNQAAGLFRMSRFAGYVKANMPLGASYEFPQLSDEEAWDLAAFVNSQDRPEHPFLETDWPDISKKPYDHPFGPFADTFPEIQHKYGPFGPIAAFYKK
ncbi:MAG: c-type cytochrome [Saprospiraceae bacterium]